MRRTTILNSIIISSLCLAPVAAVAAELQVYDLTTKKHLNVRSGPSLKDPVIGGLMMGDTVMNMGCKDNWCSIETKAGMKGYSYQAFLKDAAMAPAAQAPAPIPRFAIGTLKCERNNGSPVADCSFGVLRIGAGARLQVTWADATKRMFGVFGPAVTSQDGPVNVKQAADGSYDVTLLPKGAPTEHYTVPASVITGK